MGSALAIFVMGALAAGLSRILPRGGRALALLSAVLVICGVLTGLALGVPLGTLLLPLLGCCALCLLVPGRKEDGDEL